MKLSSGKLQFWEWMGKDPVGAGTFCPSPILVYYISMLEMSCDKGM
jgi:hypothetical protein